MTQPLPRMGSPHRVPSAGSPQQPYGFTRVSICRYVRMLSTICCESTHSWGPSESHRPHWSANACQKPLLVPSPADLLTGPVASRTRKRFRAVRLLSAPKEKPFPSVRNVSESPDRPREEIPRLGSGCADRPGRNTDGLCPLLNNFGCWSDAEYESPVAIIISPYAPAKGLHNGKGM